MSFCSSRNGPSTDAYSAESIGNEIAQTLGSGSADIFEGTSGGLFNKNYVTLDLMTQLSSYGVVIISADCYQPKDQGLSSYNYEHYGDTYIMLGAESKSAKNKKYSADYSNSNIKVVVGSEGWLNCRFAVGKGFFTDHYSTGALNDSFWFLNCPGLLGNEIKSDTGYAQALTGRGAKAVMGFSTQISNMANSKIVMDKIFSELTNGKTVSAARNTLNGRYKTATILKGNSSYRLFKSGTVKTGAQASGNSDFCLQIGEIEARPGEYIDLPIRNTGTAVRLGCIISGIAICQPLELKYVDLISNPALDREAYFSKDGRICARFDTPVNVPTDGLIYILHIQVPDNIEPGVYPISFRYCDVFGPYLESTLRGSYVDGMVIIKEPTTQPHI